MHSRRSFIATAATLAVGGFASSPVEACFRLRRRRRTCCPSNGATIFALELPEHVQKSGGELDLRWSRDFNELNCEWGAMRLHVYEDARGDYAMTEKYSYIKNNSRFPHLFRLIFRFLKANSDIIDIGSGKLPNDYWPLPGVELASGRTGRDLEYTFYAHSAAISRNWAEIEYLEACREILLQ